MQLILRKDKKQIISVGFLGCQRPSTISLEIFLWWQGHLTLNWMDFQMKSWMTYKTNTTYILPKYWRHATVFCWQTDTYQQNNYFRNNEIYPQSQGQKKLDLTQHLKWLNLLLISQCMFVKLISVWLNN